MSFKTKQPPNRLILNREQFNKLVTIAKYNDEKLYDKLIKYTFCTDENNIVVRLFPSEVQSVFFMIFNKLNDINVKEDFYINVKKVFNKDEKGEC